MLRFLNIFLKSNPEFKKEWISKGKIKVEVEDALEFYDVI
jgi:hypothetical protein